MKTTFLPKSPLTVSKLYYLLITSFSVIVVVSNVLSAKMVVLPLLNLTIPAGLITYPLTFLLSDLVTEIYGVKRAKFMVYTALAMSLLSFGMIQLGLILPTEGNKEFQVVLGLSGLRIFSSLSSYVISQLAGIQFYMAIKRWTGPNWLWLRNNGATCFSQLIDTLMIDLIFLCWGLGMPFVDVLPIMLFSYAYKAFFSVACTPIFYLIVFLIRREKKSLNKITHFRSPAQ
jgi:queuosine precursor transporter